MGHLNFWSHGLDPFIFPVCILPPPLPLTVKVHSFCFIPFRVGVDLREDHPVKDVKFDKESGLWTVTIEKSSETFQVLLFQLLTKMQSLDLECGVCVCV